MSWRGCLRGATSLNWPPATVQEGLGMRRMNRSSLPAAMGRSRESRIQAWAPGLIVSPFGRIDREPRPPDVSLRLDRVKDRVDGRHQLAHPLTRDRRNALDHGSVQRCVLEGVAHLALDQLIPDLVDEVDLGQRYQAMADLQQVDDLEVFPGLRHDALIRGHDEDDRIDSLGAGEHVADEARMSGHIHDSDLAPAGQAQVGEAEVDRHPPPFFLGQPVGVDSGQRRHQRGLAVVDVPCGAQDHFRTLLTAASTASISSSSSPRSTVRGSMQQASFSMREIRGGSPRRSAVASREAGPAKAMSMGGSAWPGREPPPAADSPGVRVVLTPRSSSFTDHLPARLRMSAIALRSMRSTRISSRCPASRCRSVASIAASVSLSIRKARASACRDILRTASMPRALRARITPACGPPNNLSPENVTTSESRSDSATVGSSAIGSAAPLPRSSMRSRSWRRVMASMSVSETASVKPDTR